MQAIVFYSETSSNGKFQIKSNIELDGKGIKKVGSNYNHTHASKIYKNLGCYWVNAYALNNIKLHKSFELIKTSF